LLIFGKILYQKDISNLSSSPLNLCLIGNLNNDHNNTVILFSTHVQRWTETWKQPVPHKTEASEVPFTSQSLPPFVHFMLGEMGGLYKTYILGTIFFFFFLPLIQSSLLQAFLLLQRTKKHMRQEKKVSRSKPMKEKELASKP